MWLSPFLTLVAMSSRSPQQVSYQKSRGSGGGKVVGWAADQTRRWAVSWMIGCGTGLPGPRPASWSSRPRPSRSPAESSWSIAHRRHTEQCSEASASWRYLAHDGSWTWGVQGLDRLHDRTRSSPDNRGQRDEASGWPGRVPTGTARHFSAAPGRCNERREREVTRRTYHDVRDVARRDRDRAAGMTKYLTGQCAPSDQGVGRAQEGMRAQSVRRRESGLTAAGTAAPPRIPCKDREVAAAGCSRAVARATEAARRHAGRLAGAAVCHCTCCSRYLGGASAGQPAARVAALRDAVTHWALGHIAAAARPGNPMVGLLKQPLLEEAEATAVGCRRVFPDAATLVEEPQPSLPPHGAARITTGSPQPLLKRPQPICPAGVAT